MVDLRKKRKTSIIMALYLVTFYIVWFLYTVFLDPILDNSPIVVGVIGSNLCKILFWTFPVILMLSYVFKHDPIKYLKINNNVFKGLMYGISVGALLVLTIILRKAAIPGDLRVNFLFDVNVWIGGVLLIGVTEEIVFRGYILQKFKEVMGFGRANVITSVLFVLIHLPKYFVEGKLFSMGFMTNSVFFLLTFSYVQGILFKRTDSIWPCFIFHSANNFAMFAFIA